MYLVFVIINRILNIKWFPYKIGISYRKNNVRTVQMHFLDENNIKSFVHSFIKKNGGKLTIHCT